MRVGVAFTPVAAATSQQLLIVLADRVSYSAGGEAGEMGVEEAVEWQEGEWHETRF